MIKLTFKGRVNTMEKSKKTRKRISEETKQYVIKMITEEGVRIRDIAYKMEIGESTIGRWLKEYREAKNADPNQPRYITNKEHDKMKADYEKKLRDLEEENEILKKAMHIFAKNRE